ncbi:MAG: GntR family transcriptional regulator [Erysipelotrichaceae bacterium]|nr:GntR family transcriptional regulator [Erysipelotrichaceae bacterium]
MPRVFSENVPIYLQLIEMLKVSIVTGEYKADDKLPPVRELALRYGVNPNTVQRAYSELEREGIVQSERTSGRYINIDAQKINELKKGISEEYIRELFERLRQIGLSGKEIKNLVNKWEENK